MLKKVFAILMVLIMMFCLFSCKKTENPYLSSPLPESVYLSSGMDEKTTLKYDIYEDYIIITGAIASLSTLYVPEMIEGKEVKAIEKDAFSGMDTLTAVTVSDTVIEIRDNAFYGCTSLENVVLSENLYLIGNAAFSENTSLKSIRIPLDTVVIGGHAFSGCTSLKNIVIPKNAQSIGGGAFNNTPWLASQKDKFVIAGQNVLIHYNGTDESVTVPDGIVEVSAFSENFFVRYVTLPASVERIGEYAFMNSSLNEITLGENVTIIATAAFDSCLDFTKINFNSKIEFIGDYAFSGCHKIEEITLPDTVKSVGKGAFVRCSGLTYLTFNSAKTEIGEDICESCSSLKKISCPKKSPVIDYAKSNGFNLDII